RKMYFAQVEPEDWYFSRLCHELKLRIGATRKVKALHAGKRRFSNESPWGEHFDSDYVHESLVPERSPDEFRFPYDIDGWLLPEEGKALADLAKDKSVLEIGSYCGK